jgi:hypothetical protein
MGSMGVYVWTRSSERCVRTFVVDPVRELDAANPQVGVDKREVEAGSLFADAASPPDFALGDANVVEQLASNWHGIMRWKSEIIRMSTSANDRREITEGSLSRGVWVNCCSRT